MTKTEFDQVSENYENVLNRGISLSGENSNYFASNRVAHMAKIHSDSMPSLKQLWITDAEPEEA